MHKPVRKLVIAGGGTAGWMTAALLRKVLPRNVDIRLVESEEIGIVGVGEATIPPIQLFNQYLGLDEKAFLKATHGTIKLGIQFENWRVPGESYIHTFGAPGATVGFCSFHHYWLKAKSQGLKQSLWDFDLNFLASQKGIFNKINTQNPVYDMPYAYHFDSALYGQYLRKLAEEWGVTRTEGKIESVELEPESGFVESLRLASGECIQGDLFVDCSGFRGLLIKQALKTNYEDWSHLLPADSAFAVPSERFATTLPYTRSIAHRAGWQWRIPLTHRNGNGIVFSSQYCSDDEALNTLLSHLDSKAIGDPRKITFQTGRTDKQWHKNVVAIGLSSGFLEPLESTSIHLIQSGIVRLMKMFPNDGVKPAMVDLYNAESKQEFETIRDFIVLHYYVNERDDSEFWRDMRALDIPERLALKIDAFAQAGALMNDQNDIFRDASWLQVMMGQGIQPQDYHPSVNALDEQALSDVMQKILAAKQQPLTKMLPHDEFLQQFTG
ncbi:tryptophan halogenase family protein [Alteromonas oceanisediminis]|uniref:tryptophan halogenase family protein n=1 Tax=Alteromonas oceanisediminis TaxID=2836180 RepID=UPI001BD9FB97|nr:tryptophan halogenase family protein [Alteromonas oceanisediminis]MBT0587371.1 tryptophan 7-halogenase [Alteromonas oceanisediminis]